MVLCTTVESDFDILASPVVRGRLPGLAPALSAPAAAAALERGMLPAGATVEGCKPGKALYLGDRGCGLRYEIDIRDDAGHRRSMLVLGRVLPDDRAVASYGAAVAAVADAAGPGVVDGAARPWAVLPGRLLVHAFPIDPELPTLVDAVAPAKVGGLLRDHLPAFDVSTVTVEHYGRRDRCVLRYDGRGSAPATVYGKVWSDDRGGPVSATMANLDGRLGPAVVPRLYAYVPEVRLALLEAIPGVPALGTSLAGVGRPPERVVGDAAVVASALHTRTTSLSTRRTMDAELDELDALVQLMVRVAPDLAEVFVLMLDRIRADAANGTPLGLVPTHGDFTPSQLLTEGEECGLVDFDAMALGEAALDLGQYVAYLRLAVAKAGRPDAGAEDLVHAFLDAYVRAGSDGDALADRVRVYACVSLFRTTVHAWQKAKPKRAAMVFALLAREVACLGSPA